MRHHWWGKTNGKAVNEESTATKKSSEHQDESVKTKTATFATRQIVARVRTDYCGHFMHFS